MIPRPPGKRSRSAASLALAALLASTPLAACAIDHLPRATVVNPKLPAPEFCVHSRRSCERPGPNYRGANFEVRATPLEQPGARETTVWAIEPPSSSGHSRMILRYGQCPAGWLELTPATPLEPGYRYRFMDLEFVVEAGEVRRLREQQR